jgi:uncharacterized protein YjbI with pentapeptide repeats
MAEDPENETGLIVILASEILYKIQKGEPANYDHIRILGNFDIAPTNGNFYAGKFLMADSDGKYIRNEPAKYRIISSSITITNSKFDRNVNFIKCLFQKGIDFSGTTFSRNAFFDEAAFSENADFNGATFSGDNSSFDGVTFRGPAFFEKAMFNSYASFKDAIFSSNVSFKNVKFSENASFTRATFMGLTIFSGATFSQDAYFTEAMLNSYSYFGHFGGVRFEGNHVTFRKAVFNLAESQEDACRTAKNVLAKAGDRDGEEYHFYREMEAKRIQKGIRGIRWDSPLSLVDCLKTELWPIKRSLPRSLWRYLWYDGFEWFFIQGIFGYGVHPKRLMISWGAIVIAFGLFFWHWEGIVRIIGANEFAAGLLDCIKVSFVTAIAPGYIAAIINPGTTGYKTTSDLYTYVAMAETIVGTFLWAGFIATFAKKYMR